MRSVLFAAPLALGLLAPGAAAAQSFGDLLGKAAKTAGAAAEARRAAKAGKAGKAGKAEAVPAPAAPPATAQPAQSAGTAAANGPAPWPINLNERIFSPSTFKFSEEDKAAKAAFNAIVRVPCNDCEGGFDYEASARRFVPDKDAYNALEKLVAGLAVGGSWSWKSRGATGKLTVVSEGPVAQFQCRQVRWEITRGKASAARPGLFCMGKKELVEVF